MDDEDDEGNTYEKDQTTSLGSSDHMSFKL